MARGWPLLLLPCLLNLAPAVPEAGLSGWWTFAESDGKVVRDRSPMGHDGQIRDGEIVADGGGKVLQLPGFGAEVIIPGHQPPPNLSALTLHLLVRVERADPGAYTTLVGLPHATPSWTTPLYGFYLRGGKVVFGLWPSAGPNPVKLLLESPADLPLRTWVGLTGVTDGTTARLYLNGVEVASAPAGGTFVGNGEPFRIGASNGTTKASLQGRVGEVRFYQRALATAEVRALFEATRGNLDLTPPPPPRDFGDGTVIVETHGNSPESTQPWRAQPTRLLELLAGFQPAPTPVPVNDYGGRTDRPAEPASGFFRVVRRDGRDWLVDPTGRLFFHIGMNAVREPAGVARDPARLTDWATTVTTALRADGFNGLGNHQSKALTAIPQPLVWVLRKDFMFAFAREKKLVEPAAGTQGFPNRVMPVFHPDFEPFCERFGEDLAATANDPRLLGIMTDNELQCPVDLLDRCLALDATDPDQRGNLEAARAWLAGRPSALAGEPPTLRDRYEFIAYAFERYYRIVSRVIRRHDPNHLYLGSRLNYRSGQFDNPWFWRALAPYHDVVSVNYYGNWGPTARHFSDWADWAGKPLLITEWYAKALDPPELANTKGAGWLVRTQEDRARYYQHFALGCFETPNIVGFHWFKYRDDPTTSTALDSAGGANKGYVNIDDIPYAPLQTRARAINHRAYELLDFFTARRAP